MSVDRSNPILILSNPRSGSSLLRIMLSNHPDITIPPEAGFGQWLYGEFSEWSEKSSQNEERISQYIDKLRATRKIETWGLDYNQLHDSILLECPINYADLTKLVYKSYVIKLGKNFDRWGDKNNFFVRHLPLMNSIFGRPFVLGIIRDGRDVAVSYRALRIENNTSKYFPILPHNIEDIALEWEKNNSNIIRYMDSIAPELSMWIRYEDLVENPDLTLKNICKKVNIEFSGSMLEYTRSVENSIEPPEFLQWKKNLLIGPTTKEIGKYTRELTKIELLSFESIGKHILNRFNYQTEITGSLRGSQ